MGNWTFFESIKKAFQPFREAARQLEAELHDLNVQREWIPGMISDGNNWVDGNLIEAVRGIEEDDTGGCSVSVRFNGPGWVLYRYSTWQYGMIGYVGAVIVLGKKTKDPDIPGSVRFILNQYKNDTRVDIEKVREHIRNVFGINVEEKADEYYLS